MARMTSDEALNHPYLKDFRGSEPEGTFDGLIQIPFNDSKKLQLKEYRNALYQGKIMKKPQT
jgi:mitogen-activated protein kinase 15